MSESFHPDLEKRRQFIQEKGARVYGPGFVYEGDEVIAMRNVQFPDGNLLKGTNWRVQQIVTEFRMNDKGFRNSFVLEGLDNYHFNPKRFKKA